MKERKPVIFRVSIFAAALLLFLMGATLSQARAFQVGSEDFPAFPAMQDGSGFKYFVPQIMVGAGTGQPTRTPTRTRTSTSTRRSFRTRTPTPAPGITRTATDTPTYTPTRTPTGAWTNTPTRTPTFTPTRTPTFTPTGSRTYTPTPTRTFTPTGTRTNTPTGTRNNTPTRTPTGSRTNTPTRTLTFTPSSTPTGSRTFTPTGTRTYTPAPTRTFTPTGTRTNTPTPTRTFTPSSTPNSTLTGYFVATAGSDSNPGTQSQPWKTISKAAGVAAAGDTVYVRGGVYAEQVILAKSGAQNNPIRFQAYPGETPVIEGSGLSIPNGSSLLELRGSWIVASGFEVRNSKYLGIELSGQHNVVDNVYSHHSVEQGILARGDYSTVQNSRAWRNALNNLNGKMSGGGWATGISAARDNVDGKTDNAVLRNNVSWENWGEGVSSFEASGTLIEGNIVYDNYSTNIYISDSTNVLCEGNLVYMTPDNTYTKGYGAHVGIMMGDEVYKPASANNTVINNIAYGNARNFFYWQGDQGGGLNNVLIANNTFVNSTTEAGVVINQGTHQNSRFIDNLIVQDGSLPIAAIVANAQLTVSNNLWSKTPPGAASGTGDVVGDPLLAKVGTPYSVDWYRLLTGSPAIDKATLLPQVTQDYTGAARGSAPDLGALEK